MRAFHLARFLANDPVASARIGQTPHVVLHRENKSTVRYFPAVSTAPARAPVFISMPLINTWTIFDLLPGRSIVQALTEAGAPVYLLDWGRPGPEDREIRAVDLIDGLLHRAMNRSRRHAGQPLDAIGYCVGGTFLAAYLARHPEAARRVALVATPIDFHASGRLAGWAKPETFPLDAVIDGLGNFPSSLMKTSFVWLKPEGQGARLKTLWERFDDEDFAELWAAMEKWNGDNIDFPGEVYRDYVRACYFDNALMTGTWVLGTEATDLSQCNIPALVLAGTGDHIVPAAAATALTEVWGGPVESEVLKGGHVGMCVGKRLPAALVLWVERGVEA